MPCVVHSQSALRGNANTQSPNPPYYIISTYNDECCGRRSIVVTIRDWVDFDMATEASHAQ